MSAQKTLAFILILSTLSPLVQAAPAFDEKPTPIMAPLPDYPRALRKEQAEGTVVIGVSIDEKGNVADAVVVKSTDNRFEAAALEVVRSKWKFKPAKKDGAPVACKVNVPIRFSLNE